MFAVLRGAGHPVDVRLAPTEAERRLRSNEAIRGINRFWECEARKIDGLIVYVGQHLKKREKRGKQ
jgi:hypothetical protein